MGKQKKGGRRAPAGVVPFDDTAAAAEGAPLKGEKRKKDKDRKAAKHACRRRPAGAHAYAVDDLEAELAAIGLRVKEVSADGNCLFRALSDQLHGNEGAHAELRARVVGHVEAEAEAFAPFVEDDEPFDKYIKRMKKDGTWAGHIELQAASAALQSNLCIYQAGQPCWRIHLDGGVPTLHISYHDGMHFNSVRMAGDYINAPPQPIMLSAAAADPAAVAAAQRQWGPDEVERVAAGTGCSSRPQIERVLEECRGSVDEAIEKLIELLANEAEPLGEALAGRGEAAEPEAAASAAAEAGSGAAESKPAAAAQQGASPPPEQPAAATALQPAASSSGHGEGSCVELLLQPANGSWEQVAVQLRLVGGASQGEADAAAEPGPSSNAAAAHADGESSGSDGAGLEGSGGRRQAAGEGSKGASSGHGRKGVRLKGKGGQAGREGKGPPRNKPCPCGSKQKYKNCCGAKRGAAARGAGSANQATDSDAAAAAAAKHLQTLFI